MSHGGKWANARKLSALDERMAGLMERLRQEREAAEAAAKAQEAAFMKSSYE
jgi:hypothetical protein